jgi:integrase
MRQGELLALTWGDVNTLEARISVRQHHVAGIGTVKGAKSDEGRREIALPTKAVTMLGELWNEQGKPADLMLVFPGPNGVRHNSNLTRQLYNAMERAGIPREGPTGEKRTFHSLRHTYARVAVERGVALKSLQRQLGHATLSMTADTYGHFGDKARKVEAAKLEGAFKI